MQQRPPGLFIVSAIGLGCMNMCHAFGAPISDAATRLDAHINPHTVASDCCGVQSNSAVDTEVF